MSEFKKELGELINKHNKENKSNTPDFILAAYLAASLKAFEMTQELRDEWYNITKKDKK